MFVRVLGRSMVPTLRPGDVFFVQPYWRAHPQRGEIVLLDIRHPIKGRFMKRVVGLPGETLRIEQTGVWVDGKPLSELYVPTTAALQPQATVTLRAGPNEFIVLGDARDDSLDSRRWGAISREDIKGVLRFRLWPFWHK